VLEQALAMYDSRAERLLECEDKIKALLEPMEHHEIALEGASKPGGKNTDLAPRRRIPC
jgi:transposase